MKFKFVISGLVILSFLGQVSTAASVDGILVGDQAFYAPVAGEVAIQALTTAPVFSNRPAILLAVPRIASLIIVLLFPTLSRQAELMPDRAALRANTHRAIAEMKKYIQQYIDAVQAWDVHALESALDHYDDQFAAAQSQLAALRKSGPPVKSPLVHRPANGENNEAIEVIEQEVDELIQTAKGAEQSDLKAIRNETDRLLQLAVKADAKMRNRPSGNAKFAFRPCRGDDGCISDLIGSFLQSQHIPVDKSLIRIGPPRMNSHIALRDKFVYVLWEPIHEDITPKVTAIIVSNASLDDLNQPEDFYFAMGELTATLDKMGHSLQNVFRFLIDLNRKSGLDISPQSFIQPKILKAAVLRESFQTNITAKDFLRRYGFDDDAKHPIAQYLRDAADLENRHIRGEEKAIRDSMDRAIIDPTLRDLVHQFVISDIANQNPAAPPAIHASRPVQSGRLRRWPGVSA